jgi:hypothetical protein
MPTGSYKQRGGKYRIMFEKICLKRVDDAAKEDTGKYGAGATAKNSNRH